MVNNSYIEEKWAYLIKKNQYNVVSFPGDQMQVDGSIFIRLRFEERRLLDL